MNNSSNSLIKARLATILPALTLFLLLSAGCGRNENDADPLKARTSGQAATQLEQAFSGAAAELKANADLASQAIRDNEYEKAVVSLQAVRDREGVTLEQGLAIHSCVLTLEERLIRAMEAGDENARRSYQLLKRMKRN